MVTAASPKAALRPDWRLHRPHPELYHFNLYHLVGHLALLRHSSVPPGSLMSVIICPVDALCPIFLNAFAYFSDYDQTYGKLDPFKQVLRSLYHCSVLSENIASGRFGPARKCIGKCACTLALIMQCIARDVQLSSD